MSVEEGHVIVLVIRGEFAGNHTVQGDNFPHVLRNKIEIRVC